MTGITINPRDADANARIKAAFAGIFPIPKEPTDSEHPEGEQRTIYTETEWVRMCIINYIKNIVKRYEHKKAVQELVFEDVEDIII